MEVIQIKRAAKTRYIILGLLAHCPHTGYGIKKSIEDEHSHFWQESYGQIYPTLKKLVDEELAEKSKSEDESNGRGQIMYTITDKGRQVLKDWLAEGPEVEKLRYELLVKVSFGDNTDPEVIIGHLDEFIKRNEENIKHAEFFLEHFKKMYLDGDDHTYKELTSLCGKYFYTMMRDWAIEAKQIITERMIDDKE